MAKLAVLFLVITATIASVVMDRHAEMASRPQFPSVAPTTSVWHMLSATAR